MQITTKPFKPAEEKLITTSVPCNKILVWTVQSEGLNSNPKYSNKNTLSQSQQTYLSCMQISTAKPACKVYTLALHLSSSSQPLWCVPVYGHTWPVCAWCTPGDLCLSPLMNQRQSALLQKKNTMWAKWAQQCVCVLHVPNFSACLKSLSASIIVVASSSARSTYAAAHLNKFKDGFKAEILHFSLFQNFLHRKCDSYLSINRAKASTCLVYPL